MKKPASLIVASVFAVLLLNSSGRVFAAEATTLKAATGWFKEYVINDPFWEFKRRVEEASGGSLKIDWRGGPEALPAFDAIGALSRGVIDVLYTATSYYVRVVPEAVFKSYLDGKTKPIRDSGLFDLFDKIHRERAGAKLLGLTSGSIGYAMFTKKPIQKLDDFKGLKIRSTPLYVPLIEGVGASPITIAPAELYTALERGVVEGYAWPTIGSVDMKFYEVSCCVIKPFFYTLRQPTMINLQTWERLKPDQRALLQKTIIDLEDWTWDHFRKKLADEMSRLVSSHGMKVIELPEGEAKRYRQIAYEGAWAKSVPTSPKYGTQIQKMAEPFSKPWPPLY